jgi:predicted RNase H-like HicB family nuclease
MAPVDHIASRDHDEPTEIEFVFEPQEEGGYTVYAPELPGLHTEGHTLDEAIANA